MEIPIVSIEFLCYNNNIIGNGLPMIPSYIEPFLWSYDTKKIDLNKHKDRIIVNVLKYGTPKATDWVMKRYSREEIRQSLEGPVARELDPKSRKYWALLFDIRIPSTSRTFNKGYAL